MVYKHQMNHKGRRYFLYKEYSSFEQARQIAQSLRRRWKIHYKITKCGLFGGWEVWTTKRYY